MFYGSRNYGGCLQAYALQKFLEQNGFDAEQINFKKTATASGKINKIRRIMSLSPSVLAEKLKRRTSKKSVSAAGFSLENCQKRADAFDKFKKDFVRSSDVVYSSANIKNAEQVYDTFVVGSDQVWNEVTADSPYLLGFADEKKQKISYAASISQEKLSSYAKRVFKNALVQFDAVSVREERAVQLLSECGDEKIEWVLDPTFLLDKVHWDGIAEQNMYEFPYLFCYFLSDDIRLRSAAESYAACHGLKIITLPFLQNKPNAADSDFGDIKLWNISPTGFLSLIKNAEAVFTDSFHSTVFSYIFEKQFFTFARKEGNTNSRIKSLLLVTDKSERLCDISSADVMGDIQNLAAADYKEKPQILNEMLQKSKDFLINNLKEN